MDIETLLNILRNGSEEEIKKLVGDAFNMVVLEGIDTEVYPKINADTKTLMNYILNYTDHIRVYNTRLKKIIYLVFTR